jgi:hypothetical protein
MVGGFGQVATGESSPSGNETCYTSCPSSAITQCTLGAPKRFACGYSRGCRKLSALPTVSEIFRTLSVALRGHGSPDAEEWGSATFMALWDTLTTAKTPNDRGSR